MPPIVSSDLSQPCPNEVKESSVSDSSFNPETNPTAAPAKPKLNILLVDDDKMMHEMGKLIIGDKANLQCAENGDLAFGLAVKAQFDIIFLDINLKHRINGIEVQHQLRQMPNYADIPIIAFTAYAIIGDEERFLQHGFSNYLSKPFTIESFLKCIKLEYPDFG